LQPRLVSIQASIVVAAVIIGAGITTVAVIAPIQAGTVVKAIGTRISVVVKSGIAKTGIVESGVVESATEATVVVETVVIKSIVIKSIAAESTSIEASAVQAVSIKPITKTKAPMTTEMMTSGKTPMCENGCRYHTSQHNTCDTTPQHGNHGKNSSAR
jgi:hypothetical protein